MSTTFDLAVKHGTKYHGGDCCVFACNALTGDYTEGTRGLIQPPMKIEQTHARFDSTVDNMNNPEKIAFYLDWQVLPRYLFILH